jgi:tetratricopeptide (TPR) repeat protein
MDDIQKKLDDYHFNEVEVKAEVAEFENLSSQLRKQARTFINDLGGIPQLVNLRQQHNPPRKNWWWYLDIWLAEQQKQFIKKTAIRLAIASVVILVGILLYQRFLAPDPTTIAIMDHQRTADSLFSAKDFAGALQETDAALALSPDNAEMLIYRGIILENLNRLDDAEKSYQLARKYLPSEDYFYLTRATLYINLGDFNKVLSDSNKAIEINPNSPQAYLLNGSALEELGLFNEASQAYDKCAALAEKTNSPELAAQAKIKQAYMIQRMNALPAMDVGTPTAP